MKISFLKINLHEVFMKTVRYRYYLIHRNINTWFEMCMLNVYYEGECCKISNYKWMSKWILHWIWLSRICAESPKFLIGVRLALNISLTVKEDNSRFFWYTGWIWTQNNSLTNLNLLTP